MKPLNFEDLDHLYRKVMEALGKKYPTPTETDKNGFTKFVGETTEEMDAITDIFWHVYIKQIKKDKKTPIIIECINCGYSRLFWGITSEEYNSRPAEKRKCDHCSKGAYQAS